MNTTEQNTKLDYSGNLYNHTTKGTGEGRGLATIGDALTAAGVTIGKDKSMMGADAVQGIEAMSVCDALSSWERAATPLLAACQQQQDCRIVERSAYKLRARMQGDGKVIEQDNFRDAMQSAFHAVTLWRAGVTIERGNDGGDHLTGDNGQREKHVARVAWRALVSALSTDALGSPIQIHGGAEDDWLCAQMLPSESRAERVARHWVERHATGRQMLLARRLGNVSTGRGRRAAAVDKVGNALALMLGGDSLDVAAAAAGFKVRGRNAASDALLQACKRLSLIGGGFTIPRRGR